MADATRVFYDSARANLHPLNELLGYYKHKINDEYFDDTAAAWPNDAKQKEIEAFAGQKFVKSTIRF